MVQARKQASQPSEVVHAADENHGGGGDGAAAAAAATNNQNKSTPPIGGGEGDSGVKPRPPKVQKQPSFFSPAPPVEESDKKWR